MSSIFTNGYVTIAADASASVIEGCFRRVPQEMALEREITWSTPRGYEYRCFFRQPLHHSPASKRDWPLRSRGWAFQEWLLSPRVIHFTPLELMWDCAALLRSECDANPASNTFREIELGGIWRDMRSLAHMSDHSTNEQWSDIIEAYSRRLLTKEEDKLPALSGIAQDYHKRFSRVRKICRGPLGVRNP